jgi:glycosyltransferase involved in cell wall biosynthesis
MKDPLVSVVIPCHDASGFIGRTLETACGQTYRNLEILVVDDGSTDDTVALVRARMAGDDRIRLILQPNQGVAIARNRAIIEARGDLIAPLDADDLWHPEKIRQQVDRMQACSQEVALVYCWPVNIDEQDTMRATQVSEEPPTYEGYVLPALIQQNFIGCASVPLFRRSCALEVGGYDPRLREQDAEGCEDRDLYLKMAERWKFAAVRRFLVGYRVRKGSMSRCVPAMMRSHRFVISEARSRHPEIPPAVFRWSGSRMSAWLAKRSALDLRLGTAAVLWAQAVGLDPLYSLLTLPRMIGMTFRHSAALAFRSRPKRREPFSRLHPSRRVARPCWIVRRRRSRIQRLCQEAQQGDERDRHATASVCFVSGPIGEGDVADCPAGRGRIGGGLIE